MLHLLAGGIVVLFSRLQTRATVSLFLIGHALRLDFYCCQAAWLSRRALFLEHACLGTHVQLHCRDWNITRSFLLSSRKMLEELRMSFSCRLRAAASKNFLDTLPLRTTPSAIFQNASSNCPRVAGGALETPNHCKSDATSRNKSARRSSSESPFNKLWTHMNVLVGRLAPASTQSSVEAQHWLLPQEEDTAT